MVQGYNINSYQSSEMAGLARVQIKGHNDVIRVETLVSESTREFEVNTLFALLRQSSFGYVQDFNTSAVVDNAHVYFCKFSVPYGIATIWSSVMW